MEKEFCRRCLLSEDSGNKALAQLVTEYLAAIPQEQKVEEDIYTLRLHECKMCDYLLSGMCRVCGCYVEVRAVRHFLHCPDTPARW